MVLGTCLSLGGTRTTESVWFLSRTNAMPAYRPLLVLLFVLCSLRGYSTDTLKVYFPLGDARLSEAAITTLDSAMYFELFSKWDQVQIIGYADFLGATRSNDTLSERRARAVAAYFSENGFAPEQLILVVGKGELPSGNQPIRKGIAGHRRVDIIRPPAATPPAPAKAAPTTTAPVPSTENTSLDELMRAAPVGQTLRLGKIYFEPGLSLIKPESLPELQALLQVMKTNLTPHPNILRSLNNLLNNIGQTTPPTAVPEITTPNARDRRRRK